MNYFYNWTKKPIRYSVLGKKENKDFIYKRETFGILKLKKDNKNPFSQWQMGIIGRNICPGPGIIRQELSGVERRKISFS